MKSLIDLDANTLLAMSQAKRTAQRYLVADVVLGNQLLELLDDLTRALDVTTATNAYCYFHENSLSVFCILIIFDL
jgi:hypothetical protein